MWCFASHFLVAEKYANFFNFIFGSLAALRRCPAGRAHCAWSGHFVTFILFLLDGLALLG